MSHVAQRSGSLGKLCSPILRFDQYEFHVMLFVVLTMSFSTSRRSVNKNSRKPTKVASANN